MNSCLHAAESMLGMSLHDQLTALGPSTSEESKRKLEDHIDESQPNKRQALASPRESPVYAPARILAAAAVGPSPSPFVGQVPPTYTPSPPAPSPTTMLTGPGPISQPAVIAVRRKRGRPSKADMEARTRERAARATPILTPIKAAPVPIPPSRPYQAAPGAGESDTKSIRTGRAMPAILPKPEAASGAEESDTKTIRKGRAMPAILPKPEAAVFRTTNLLSTSQGSSSRTSSLARPCPPPRPLAPAIDRAPQGAGRPAAVREIEASRTENPVSVVS